MFMYARVYVCPKAPKGVRFPGAGVIGGCEPTCECWDLNSLNFGEPKALLNAEPSL